MNPVLLSKKAAAGQAFGLLWRTLAAVVIGLALFAAFACVTLFIRLNFEAP